MRYDIFNVDGNYFHVIVSGRIEINAYAMEIGDGQSANFIFPVIRFEHLEVAPIGPYVKLDAGGMLDNCDRGY